MRRLLAVVVFLCGGLLGGYTSTPDAGDLGWGAWMLLLFAAIFICSCGAALWATGGKATSEQENDD